MFKTIRSQIIALVVGLMVVTSISFIFISTKYYQSKINFQQHHLAKETLASTVQLIDNEFDDILSYEIDTINNQRIIMKNAGNSLLRMAISFDELHRSGILTEQIAKEKYIEAFNLYRYQENQYFFIYDFGLNGISHPNNKMVGKKWTGFDDLKKKDALELIRDIIKDEKKAFTVFMWPRIKDQKLTKHMGFFLYFPQWEWIIGTANEMVEIERISLLKEKSAIHKIRSVSQTSLNDIGGILIFDDDGTIILNTSKLNDIDFDKTVAAIHDTFMTQSREISNYFGELVEYQIANHHQKESKQTAYVYSFKYMPWNVAVFFDWAEFSKPGSATNFKQYILLFLVLVAGILVSVFISGKITSSISSLAEFARQLSTYNFGKDRHPKLDYIMSHNRNEDIKQLTRAFLFMESQLGNYIHKLDTHKKNLEKNNKN